MEYGSNSVMFFVINVFGTLLLFSSASLLDSDEVGDLPVPVPVTPPGIKTALTQPPLSVTDLKSSVVAGQQFNGVYSDASLVKFYLYYDPKNQNVYDTLNESLASINASHYDAAKDTKFLIHGFTQNGTSSFPLNVKNAYLRHTETKFNIIAVDWGKLSSPKQFYAAFYRLAVENVPKVGVRVGQFILWLQQNNYTTLAQVHLIGQSLGAHVSSNAGNYIVKTSGVKVARVSGLDPAGPGFETDQTAAKRLEPTDAQFVDVIHVNAGVLGVPRSCGHIDFYPNGGSNQPACDVDLKELLIGATDTVGTSAFCSHGKAPVYFAMSLDPAQAENILGCACETYVAYKLTCGKECKVKSVLGEYVSKSMSGSFYLDVVPVKDKELVGSNP